MNTVKLILFILAFLAVAFVATSIKDCKGGHKYKYSLTHQQDSLLARIVTLDSLIYSLDESEAQKPIIYGKGYDRSYFRQRDTLCADRRHTTNRLNVINARVAKHD